MPQEAAFAFRPARGIPELPKEVGVEVLEICDQALAGGGVWGIGDLGAALGEPLLGLEQFVLEAPSRAIADAEVTLQ